jgi:hypothetical protein
MSNRNSRAGRRTAWTVLLLAVFAIFTTVGAYAQSVNGSIVGTVTDQTGAAIPNAAIDVTNLATGLKFHTTSDGAGGFEISAVPPGSYSAKVQSKGFQSQVVNFTVVVTTAQTLIFKLVPGAVSTTVTVTGAAPLVDTTDATIGETIQGKQVTDLPLNGRNFTQLALLTPGVTRGAYGDMASGGGSQNYTETMRNNESGSAALSVNGLRPQADNYILDGVDNNEGLVNSILFYPNIDATQEFKIDTNIAPAEYGRAGGAIVVSSTKSGTNQYHGSVFEFYRDRSFDSNPVRQRPVHRGRWVPPESARLLHRRTLPEE